MSSPTRSLLKTEKIGCHDSALQHRTAQEPERISLGALEVFSLTYVQNHGHMVVQQRIKPRLQAKKCSIYSLPTFCDVEKSVECCYIIVQTALLRCPAFEIQQ